MAENSKIEWCHHTWNPWEGCAKVSAGCDHCYAENRNARWNGGTPVNWGPGAPRRRTSDANWKLPHRWNLSAIASRVRYRVFCASLADWLDREVPTAWFLDMLRVIRATEALDWLLLTKRPSLFFTRIKQALDLEHATHGRTSFSDWITSWSNGYPPQNIWIGTSVESGNVRIADLIAIPARVRFLSCEPLLGPVDLSILGNHKRVPIHWIIAGGESGPLARPMHPDWVKDLRDTASAYQIPFFFKQWGEWLPASQYPDCEADIDPDTWNHLPSHTWTHAGGNTHTTMVSRKVGKKRAGRLLDGTLHNAFPTLNPTF